jgi:DNA ligase-1
MLAPGQSIEVQGSAAKPYIVKNHDGVIWSCTCMGWKNSGGPVNKKSCKHCRQVNGAANEAARIGAQAPALAAAIPVAIQATPAQSATPGTREATIEAQEASLGRKLRQDEKAKLFGPKLLLANGWDGTTDPTGYFISTKYDGIRAYFDGTKLVSRQGNEFPAPFWFLTGLGTSPLDMELYLGPGRFQETTSAIHGGNDGCKKLTAQIIDAPQAPGTFEQRMAWLKTQTFGSFVQLIQHTLCTGVAHLKSELLAEEARGGEGLMLRKAGSLYVPGRNSTLLKVKTFFDSEAEIAAYTDGKKAFKGMVGAFSCIIPSTITLQIGGKSCILRKGITFDVGSGLTVEQRRNPPPIGSLITFRFLELTKDGVPRNGSLVAIRDYE